MDHHGDWILLGNSRHLALIYALVACVDKL